MLKSNRAAVRVKKEGDAMPFIHNWKQIGAAVVVLAVVLAGASCKGGASTRGAGTDQQATASPNTPTPSDSATNVPASPTPTIPTNAPSSASPTPTTTSTPTPTSGTPAIRWTTYRSAELGIAIPYPEGWYVEENARGTGASFYEGTPPAESDMPPRLWVDAQRITVDEFVQQLDGIESDERVVRAGRNMRRIVRRDDLSDDEGLAISYIWDEGGITYRMGGRQNDALLEQVIDRLEEER